MFSSQGHHLHGQEVLKFILGCCHANFFLFSLSLNGTPTNEKSIEIEISRICSHNSEGRVSQDVAHYFQGVYLVPSGKIAMSRDNVSLVFF